MINIIEYLIGNNKKTKKVDKPTKDCNVQDIIDWLDSFGVENWYENHSFFDTLEKGSVGYQINSGSWGSKCVSLDIPIGDRTRQSIVITPKYKSYVSWGYGTKDQDISFEKAIDLMEKIMENPREPKILKREEL